MRESNCLRLGAEFQDLDLVVDTVVAVAVGMAANTVAVSVGLENVGHIVDKVVVSATMSVDRSYPSHQS